MNNNKSIEIKKQPVSRAEPAPHKRLLKLLTWSLQTTNRIVTPNFRTEKSNLQIKEMEEGLAPHQKSDENLLSIYHSNKFTTWLPLHPRSFKYLSHPVNPPRAFLAPFTDLISLRLGQKCLLILHASWRFTELPCCWRRRIYHDEHSYKFSFKKGHPRG